MQEKLLDKGYFTMPLLDEEQVEQCQHIFQQSDKGKKADRYNSLEINDYEHRKFVRDELEKTISEPVLPLFRDYKFLGFNFAVKKAGPETGFPSHIDDVHADESRFLSVNIWIPLVDVSPLNGTLYVIPYSHKLPQPLSGIGLPYPFTEQEHLIQDKKVHLTLSAGEALFFHTRLIHGSPDNRSNQDRPAIIAGLIPSEAEPFVYMWHDGLPADKVAQYEAGEAFFLGTDIRNKPEHLPCHGIFDYKTQTVSDKKLQKILDNEL